MFFGLFNFWPKCSHFSMLNHAWSIKELGTPKRKFISVYCSVFILLRFTTLGHRIKNIHNSSCRLILYSRSHCRGFYIFSNAGVRIDTIFVNKKDTESMNGNVKINKYAHFYKIVLCILSVRDYYCMFDAAPIIILTKRIMITICNEIYIIFWFYELI